MVYFFSLLAKEPGMLKYFGMSQATMLLLTVGSTCRTHTVPRIVIQSEIVTRTWHRTDHPLRIYSTDG